MYFIFGGNEKCELMFKHRRKSQATLTRHSDKSNTVRKGKKRRCKTPYKIMTDNQKMNKTSMKHVQQQHFIQDVK